MIPEPRSWLYHSTPINNSTFSISKCSVHWFVLSIVETDRATILNRQSYHSSRGIRIQNTSLRVEMVIMARVAVYRPTVQADRPGMVCIKKADCFSSSRIGDGWHQGGRKSRMTFLQEVRQSGVVIAAAATAMACEVPLLLRGWNGITGRFLLVREEDGSNSCLSSSAAGPRFWLGCLIGRRDLFLARRTRENGWRVVGKDYN